MFTLLRNQRTESTRGCRHLELFGEPVCNKGFLKLLAIGKLRFQRLCAPARDPQVLDCPVDQRYTPKGRQGTEKEQIVFDFLQGLYSTAAENLPDCPSASTSNKRPRHGSCKRDDPDMDRSQIRHLPPGTIQDYLRLLQADHPNVKFSANLFARVWGEHFMDKLRIRGSTHHSRCSVCVRHRLIIRRVGKGPARLGQLVEYRKHLKRQYDDRVNYWASRSTSRLESTSGDSVQFICGILDSMDQSKHCWPRSEAMCSKDFASWVRPRMSSTTFLLHGHGALVCLSPPHVPTNSSRTVEILACGMTRCIKAGIDWRKVHFRLQSDNCAKECKNQTVLRWLGQMVATHRLRAATMACLQSGHSHEDVDALFSTMATYIDRHKELWTMGMFQQCLQKFLDQDHIRPDETKFRSVEILTQFHDWRLSQNKVETNSEKFSIQFCL